MARRYQSKDQRFVRRLKRFSNHSGNDEKPRLDELASVYSRDGAAGFPRLGHP